MEGWVSLAAPVDIEKMKNSFFWQESYNDFSAIELFF
jgi:hypothetical protein